MSSPVQMLDAAEQQRLRERLIQGHSRHFFPRGGKRAGDSEALSAADVLLFEAWLARRSAEVAGNSLAGTVTAAVSLLSRLMISSRQLAGVAVDSPEREELEGSAYARLVLGVSSPLGINHLLQRLLRACGLEAQLVQTPAVGNLPRHVVVLTADERGHGFADAWSDHPLLVVAGFDAGRVLSGAAPAPAAGAVEYASLAGPSGDYVASGLLPRDAYVGVAVLSSPERAADVESARHLLRQAPPASSASSEPWRRFLELRVAEVEGALERPQRAYAELLESGGLQGSTKRLVEQLAQRHGYQLPSTARDRALPQARRGYDLDDRMRQGDVSAWTRWSPKAIDAGDIRAAWSRALSHRGEPGHPATVLAYTHFPFCISSCNFCMYWHVVPNEESQHARHVAYLQKQVEWFEQQFGRTAITSAYFGGGTPTATPTAELRRYLESFNAAFDVRGEFSVEGHPQTTTAEKLELLGAHGVNRVSMGLQSFEHDVLVRITRRNAPLEHLRELVATAQRVGIEVNLDLVLGLPEQTLASFRRDVAQVLSLRSDVVTLYRYQPVSRLPQAPSLDMTFPVALDDELRKHIDGAGFTIVGNVDASTKTLLLENRTRRWAPRDMYVQFDERPSHTIGLGPGAFGHIFGRYYYREVTALSATSAGRPHYWGTAITPEDEGRSLLLTAIRTGNTVDLAELANTTGVDFWQSFGDVLRAAQRAGLLQVVDGTLTFLDGNGREELIDQLVPRRAQVDRSLPVIDTATMERELVALPEDERNRARNRELIRRLCRQLKIPARGLQYRPGVWVGDHDDESVYLHIGERKADPVRVIARPPGAGVALFRNRELSVNAGHADGRPFTPRERHFLNWMFAQLPR